MNEVIIRILDSSNSVLGDLDLKSFNDFPLVITKGIVNLDNLKARTGSYTKSFKVPNTKNNSKLLNSLDDINSRKDYNSALNRKECVIIVNGSIIDKGFIQVSKVYQGFELDSFELVFFGNNIDWVKQAADKKLNEINWTNNSQTVSKSVINSYNDPANGGSDTYDIAFPYISRGGNDVAADSTVSDYYPVFYIRRIIENGLNDLGWNVSSTFLTNSNIKKLVADFPLKYILTESDVEATRVRASKENAYQRVNYLDTVTIQFNDDSTSPNKDSGGNYNNSTYIYTAPETATYQVSLTISSAAATIGRPAIDIYVQFKRVGGGSYQYTMLLGGTSRTSTLEFEANLEAGVEYYFQVLGNGPDVDGILNYEAFDIAGGNASYPTYFTIQRKSKLEQGDVYNLNDVIPDEYKLLDVINDFTRMFNIYYWTDVKTRTVYFEERDSFFESTTNAIDWTDKLDLSKKYELDYVSSYKRNIVFSYKDLNSDEWLKGWNYKNKRKYGSYDHPLPDRFAEGTTSIQLDTFSAAYTYPADEVTPITSGTYIDDEKPITIKIWNEDQNIPQPEYRINDYNPKIYFFENGTQTALSGLSRKIVKFGTTETTIPYGIFEDYSNVSSPISLNFASNTAKGIIGLFERYYAKMMKNIEEGGRLIAYFNLDNVDIENLDFRKLVYIDYPAQVKGYYLIESVIDYNPIKNGLTKVSLFKFENLGSVSIDSSQEGNNSVDTDNGNLPQPLEPIYVEDGSGNLIEVVIENPFNGWLYPVYK